MLARKILAGVECTALALTLGACGSQTPTETPGAGASSGAATGEVRLWVMEGSLSDESRQYLIDEFATANPGSELKIEVQQWDGIVSKLQTSLASKNESPDLVEIGNTQTTTFTTVGAFADVTDMKATLGGDDLIPSFVDASTVDGSIYAYPLYAGARAVYYRTDLFEAAGIEVPTTIDEFTEAAIALQAANPEGTPNFSGMFLAADWAEASAERCVGVQACVWSEFVLDGDDLLSMLFPRLLAVAERIWNREVDNDSAADAVAAEYRVLREHGLLTASA